MNLILSGAYDESLVASTQRMVKPSTITRLHDNAVRLEAIEDSEVNRSQVEISCDIAKVDYAFVKENQSLSTIKLLAMDMDSTLITIECIDELAEFAGKRSEVARITEETMEGKIVDFSESLKRRVALLKGINSEVVRRVFDERLYLSPGATELIDVAQRHKIYTLLLSGGFTYFTERLVHSLGLNAAYANTLEIKDKKLTGRIINPIVDAASKARHVTETMKMLGCGRNAAIVIGDGANDILMMRCVEHSIAYHAKPAVIEAASIAIKYGTLRTTLDFFFE